MSKESILQIKNSILYLRDEIALKVKWTKVKDPEFKISIAVVCLTYLSICYEHICVTHSYNTLYLLGKMAWKEEGR